MPIAKRGDDSKRGGVSGRSKAAGKKKAVKKAKSAASKKGKRVMKAAPAKLYKPKSKQSKGFAGRLRRASETKKIEVFADQEEEDDEEVLVEENPNRRSAANALTKDAIQGRIQVQNKLVKNSPKVPFILNVTQSASDPVDDLAENLEGFGLDGNAANENVRVDSNVIGGADIVDGGRAVDGAGNDDGEVDDGKKKKKQKKGYGLIKTRSGTELRHGKNFYWVEKGPYLVRDPDAAPKTDQIDYESDESGASPKVQMEDVKKEDKEKNGEKGENKKEKKEKKDKKKK